VKRFAGIFWEIMHRSLCFLWTIFIRS
jgi:hypothetical protein